MSPPNADGLVERGQRDSSILCCGRLQNTKRFPEQLWSVLRAMPGQRVKLDVLT
jgi:hypothetical protein